MCPDIQNRGPLRKCHPQSLKSYVRMSSRSMVAGVKFFYFVRGVAPAESETPPSLTREHRGLSPNCVPQYNQGYARNIIPGCFPLASRRGVLCAVRTPLQPGIDMNVRFPTPQRHWGVRTVWRLSANLGYPGTDYTMLRTFRFRSLSRVDSENSKNLECS